MIYLNTSTDLSPSSGYLLEWPEWLEAPLEPWPKLLAARAPDVAVNKGGGLGGPSRGEDWC